MNGDDARATVVEVVRKDGVTKATGEPKTFTLPGATWSETLVALREAGFERVDRIGELLDREDG